MATATVKNASANGIQQPARGVQLITYDWVASDKNGKLMKGSMSARHAALVRAELRRQGMNPKTVRERRKPLFSIGKAVKSTDIAIFSRQVATMMSSGVPMVQAIGIIAESQKNPRFKHMLNDIKQSIEEGRSLSESMERYPVHFDMLHRNLVHAGESAGVLDTVLDTIATYKERTETLRKKIKKALFYPILVLVVVVIVITIMLLYVVPIFSRTFESAGATLPALTRWLLDVSYFMQAYWYMIAGGIIISVMALIIGKRRSRAFAHFLDQTTLKLPIMGHIMRNSALARFARTLAVTFRAGMPLVDAMEAVAGATGNSVYYRAVKKMREDIAIGHQLQLAMRQTSLFPNMMVQMTSIGEESGTLDKMLFKAAEFYEEEVHNAVDTLSTLLEPFIMIVLGIIVGGMVVALYLPIFKLAGTF